ncbi:hypothetical protein AMAG_18810 [Allomyces macrogynus ATCC 38327]|uniref:F-box domain-containing protein n=1 Tax=Allomyces macrogynus (strain ATCC 38327) TaxID=578462 RepID=A0A0L0SI22_ALLM3|nr:hypothetical protein AMAG_18810 [Allomyces macrogynus ATCC 38327]|eukprot:KNE62104.1 hypothetical protein AMAG_18810 [Allomyces macrogynus ATCC 38327]
MVKFTTAIIFIWVIKTECGRRDVCEVVSTRQRGARGTDMLALGSRALSDNYHRWRVAIVDVAAVQFLLLRRRFRLRVRGRARLARARRTSSGDVRVHISGPDLDALPLLTTLTLPDRIIWSTAPRLLSALKHLIASPDAISELAADTCSRNLTTLAVTIRDPEVRALPPHAPLRREMMQVVSPSVLSTLSRSTVLETVQLRSVVDYSRLLAPLTLEYHSSHPLWPMLPTLPTSGRFASALTIHVGNVDDMIVAVHEIVAVVQWATARRALEVYKFLAFNYGGPRFGCSTEEERSAVMSVVSLWGEWSGPSSRQGFCQERLGNLHQPGRSAEQAGPE